jgi:hypothetical protein
LTATPDNNEATAQDIGPVNCGESRNVSGVNVGQSQAWYEITLDFSLPQCSLTVSMLGGQNPHGDVFDLGTNASGFTLLAQATQSIVVSEPGTYLIDVYLPPGGSDGQFGVTFTAQ